MGILYCGQLLLDAKGRLPRDEFQAMIAADLPFSDSTARYLSLARTCINLQPPDRVPGSGVRAAAPS